jgi:pilus assembly protein CpaB
MLPIILAVVLAVVAAGIVFMYTKGAEQRVLDEQQPVSVLVSTAVIPQGMSLGDAVAGGLAEQTQVPSAMTPVGAIGGVDPTNTALVSLNNVDPGQILLASNFVTELPKITPITVPNGMIAMSLTLGDPQRVGTFVRPGSEVVIFDTSTPLVDPTAVNANQPGTGPLLTTRVLLDRVLVIGVGESTTTTPATNPDGTPAAAVSSALLTVAVDQNNAQTLIHALATGSLYLGLLGEGTEIVKNNGVTDANLFD